MLWSALVVAAALLALAALVRLIEPSFAFFPVIGETVTPRDFGAAHQPQTITTSDGERLHAWWVEAPAPRAMFIYLHGNGGNLSVWAPILVDVARHGYSVFAFDYRGYGRRTGRPTERGLYRDVAAVTEPATSD